MHKSVMKDWNVGDHVKLHTLYPKTDGKKGRITRVGTYDVDVQIGNFTFFMHKDNLEEDNA